MNYADFHTVLKYVMTDRGPIVFHRDIMHDTFRNLEPRSAGFCGFNGTQFKAWGGSRSLNIKSAPGDAQLLNECLGIRKEKNHGR